MAGQRRLGREILVVLAVKLLVLIGIKLAWFGPDSRLAVDGDVVAAKVFAQGAK